ncbi:hypothetical protein BDS110ZK25_52650 [Bradyrhizobium diazoefficiens]|uniref:Uncharacterized protein n=1 Tax=Bradyrhizobium diazoefficiens TaxID=1355477 RepID=A0A810AET3_9BRAD|nr:hypothetical protein F07S3_09130 [Bradyrhizobium diazoefficiens]BCA00042.1 hypothetical protein H12S4_09460 [Bradyrhizobium diazoefficiens]BCA09066.1 hypothetical protein BDHF08_09130 [Bradyrhizobium diazoefficiens]BCA17724.1 hypothetical protein BDHH15_09390 [Bradyrhizobium diazoefficiens]BCE18288.1 hypothetical protein XF1B_09690 [Bradyrhizobium diazoefficiens]
MAGDADAECDVVAGFLALWAIRKAMTAMRISPSQATAATGTAWLGPNSFRTSLAGFGALNR